MKIKAELMKTWALTAKSQSCSGNKIKSECVDEWLEVMKSSN